MPQKKPTKRKYRDEKSMVQKGYKKEKRNTTPVDARVLHRSLSLRTKVVAVRQPKGDRSILISSVRRLLRTSRRAVGKIRAGRRKGAVGSMRGSGPNTRGGVSHIPRMTRGSIDGGRERRLISDSSQFALDPTSVGKTADVRDQRSNDIDEHITSLRIGVVNLQLLVMSMNRVRKHLRQSGQRSFRTNHGASPPCGQTQ